MVSKGDACLAYMDMAERWGQLSRAGRKKVGCLIVKNNSIISDGINGTPSGFDNECEIAMPHMPTTTQEKYCVDCGEALTEFSSEVCRTESKPEVLHAESNAIAKLAKSTQSSVGAELFVTVSPCFECAKLIIQAGITAVYFREIYRYKDGIELLAKARIKVYQV